MKSLKTLFKIWFIYFMINFPLVYSQQTYTTPKEYEVDISQWKPLSVDNAQIWSLISNLVIGGNGVTNVESNTYLVSNTTYKDFEFSCLFRLSGNHELGLINSGIQYRSTIEDGKIIGYQADIGKGYWGDIYDEHRRGKLVGGNLDALEILLNEDGWNSYIIRCKGNKHELYINGVKSCEYIEKDASIPDEGVFGIQLHSGGNAQIEVKNVTITPL